MPNGKWFHTFWGSAVGAGIAGVVWLLVLSLLTIPQALGFSGVANFANPFSTGFVPIVLLGFVLGALIQITMRKLKLS